MRKVVEGDKEN